MTSLRSAIAKPMQEEFQTRDLFFLCDFEKKKVPVRVLLSWPVRLFLQGEIFWVCVDLKTNKESIPLWRKLRFRSISIPAISVVKRQRIAAGEREKNKGWSQNARGESLSQTGDVLARASPVRATPPFSFNILYILPLMLPIFKIGKLAREKDLLTLDPFLSFVRSFFNPDVLFFSLSQCFYSPFVSTSIETPFSWSGMWTCSHLHSQAQLNSTS